MLLAEQGDVIKVNGIRDLMLVVSNDDFNQEGGVICCPIQEHLIKSAVHPSVYITQNKSQMVGFVRCEDPRHLDLKVRRFSKVGSVDYFQMMDISDVMVSIFEYN